MAPTRQFNCILNTSLSRIMDFTPKSVKRTSILAITFHLPAIDAIECRVVSYYPPLDLHLKMQTSTKGLGSAVEGRIPRLDPSHPAGQSSGTSPLALVFGFLDFGIGGAQELILTALRHLGSQFEPQLLCIRGGGPWIHRARDQGLPVTELQRLSRPWDLRAVTLTAHWLRHEGTQILHVPLYSRASPYLRLAARWAGVPLVVAHEFGRAEPPQLIRRLADAVLKGKTRFVATSNYHREQLIQEGVNPSSIRVVYSGIDVSAFESQKGKMTRQSLNLGNRPMILVPARLHPMKGHLPLIEAFRLLRMKMPDATLWFAGQGPSRDRIREAIGTHGLGEEVHLLGQRTDIPELLAAADVVCLPSMNEGLPAALLEAFAAAKPVVATSVGGIPEALTHGDEGFLVPPNNPLPLAQALERILRAEDLGQSMGLRGRQTVQDRFSAQDTTRALEGAYLGWYDDIQQGRL